MTCDEFRDDSDALALGALSPEEEAGARAHLAACERCAAVYRAAVSVVDQLPLTVPLTRAPDAMRSAVFAAAGGRGDAPAAGDPRGAPLPLRAVPPVKRFADRPSDSPSSRGRLSRLANVFRLPTIAAALAGLTIVGLAAWSAWLQVQVHDLRQHQAAAVNAPANPTAPLAVEANSLALISAPGTLRAQLANSAASGPSGAVFWNPEQKRCIVIARQLTPPDPGQEYRVWVHTGNVGWDGGPVTPDAQGIAETVLPTDRWHVDSGYTISIVLQPVPSDGTRRTILTGELQSTSQ